MIQEILNSVRRLWREVVTTVRGVLTPRRPAPAGEALAARADANGKPDGGFSKDEIQSLAGIASALGMVPILIVIIGRLWTTTYFDHVGLPSSGLEFSIYDYAFRSREVLISLVLGASGFSAAWLYRVWLGKRGLLFALGELVFVGFLLVWAFAGVELLSPNTRTSTGVLGLSMGLPLAAMLWFAVDVWQGPGVVKRSPYRFNLPPRTLLGVLWQTPGVIRRLLLKAPRTFLALLRKMPSMLLDVLRTTPGLILRLLLKAPGLFLGLLRNMPSMLLDVLRKTPGLIRRLLLKAQGLFLGLFRKISSLLLELLRKIPGTLQHLLMKMPWLRQWRGSPEVVVPVVWRILAIALFLAIIFAYLPRISERLARVEAAADVATGKFAAAVLEADGDLPADIASAADFTRSRSVRVILSQSQNTYVLHSTECTVIGDLGAPSAELDPRGTELTDVCTVFTIPTARLKSIKYFRIGGKAPANESLLHPVEVGFGDEPFEAVFSSDNASDEEELICPADDESVPADDEGVPADDEGVRFFNSLWYELKPSEDGTVFARVETLHFTPVIGIWEVPQEDTLRLENVAGSGENPKIACEARAAPVGQPTAKAVGILINVLADTRYLASVGSQQDSGGGGTVTFEFTSGASILTPGIPEEELPTVTLPSAAGNAQLELRSLNRATYQMSAFSQLAKGPRSGFSLVLLVSEKGESVRLEKATTQDGEDRTLLATQRKFNPGVWRLQVPALREDFFGQVKLTSVTFQPDLVIALAKDSAAQLDRQVQAELLAAIDEVAIRDSLDFEGRVVVDREAVLSFEPSGDDTTTAREVIEEAGVADGLTVQIQVEEKREEERTTLLRAADIVQQQLFAAGLVATVAACEDMDICLRVFFASE